MVRVFTSIPLPRTTLLLTLAFSISMRLPLILVSVLAYFLVVVVYPLLPVTAIGMFSCVLIRVVKGRLYTKVSSTLLARVTLPSALTWFGTETV